MFWQGHMEPHAKDPWDAWLEWSAGLHRQYTTYARHSSQASRPETWMCDLYAVIKGQQAIRDLTRARTDRSGNLPPLPGIYPDYPAPVVRNTPDGRELTMARWGMPSPAAVVRGKNSDPGVTNVRNVSSPHWRRWLGVESRCVVPFTSFSENEAIPDGRRPPIWFALDESRPLACFAGMWTRWTSVRKVREGDTTNDVFAFLTTEPNALGVAAKEVVPVEPGDGRFSAEG